MKKTTIITILCLCLVPSLQATGHLDVPISSATTCDRTSGSAESSQTGCSSSFSKEKTENKTQNLTRLFHPKSNPLTKSNVSYSCAATLEYLMTHHTSFHKQSRSVMDNLAAHAERLRDVWPETFDQCLSVRIANHSAGSKGAVTHGQYCLAYFLPPTVDQMTECERKLLINKRAPVRQPVPILQSGLCIPDSCSSTDVEELLKYLLKEDASKYTIFVPQRECQTDKPKPVLLMTKIVGAGIIIIVCLAIFGTMVEVLEFTKKSKTKGETKSLLIQREASLVRSVVKCFSLFSNSWFLFNMDTINPGDVEAINGSRFITTIGFQCFHLILVANFNFWSNVYDHPFLMAYSTSGFVHIQTFLQIPVLISGTVIALSTLHRIRTKKEKFNLLSFYFRRIWKLSVPYYITLALIMWVVPYLGSGPRWPDMDHHAESCKMTWWANIFYLNNYFSEPLCQFHLWYLATEVQLTLIAPLLILAFNRSSRLGFTVAAMFVSYSVGRLFYSAYYYSLHPLAVSTNRLMSSVAIYFRSLYLLPYPRVGCYALGITMGYLFHIHGTKLKIKQSVRRWAPTVAMVFFFSPAWLWYRFESGHLPTPTHFEASLCEAFSRIVYSTSLAYFAISISAGYRDLPTRMFRTILCQKFYVLTSKLHYAVFLLHITITQCFLASRLQPIEFSAMQLFKLTFGLLILSYLVAIPFTLLVVFPFARLEKVIEQGLKRNKTEGDVKLSKMN